MEGASFKLQATTRAYAVPIETSYPRLWGWGIRSGGWVFAVGLAEGCWLFAMRAWAPTATRGHEKAPGAWLPGLFSPCKQGSNGNGA